MDSSINVIGMSSLINKNEVKKTIDIKDIENEFINKNSYFNNYQTNKNEDYISIEDYQNKLKNMNINFNNENISKPEPINSTNFDRASLYSEPSIKQSYPSPPQDVDETTSIISQLYDLDKDLNNINLSNFNDKHDHHLEYMTNEQQNQNIINNALQDEFDSNNINFDIDQESRDEKKLMLLEKIDDLRSELMDEGINIDKIPNVDYSSELDTIEYVYRVCMIKYNRHRFSGFAEEFILAGAGVLETVFNGRNEFLGLKPDLTDYSDTVRVKLRRLRHETSTIMGGVMDQYDIGPITRIMIELIPSMFLHAKLNKSQYKNNLYQDINMNQAISDLRSLE